MFFDAIWPKATGVLFLKGRLSFHHVSGKKGGTAGAPSVLIAYGEENAKYLASFPLAGCYVDLRCSTITGE